MSLPASSAYVFQESEKVHRIPFSKDKFLFEQIEDLVNERIEIEGEIEAGASSLGVTELLDGRRIVPFELSFDLQDHCEVPIRVDGRIHRDKWFYWTGDLKSVVRDGDSVIAAYSIQGAE